jgi:tyrosine-protein phosphatase SIW14
MKTVEGEARSPDMAVARKTVSKRNARVLVEEESDESTFDFQHMRAQGMSEDNVSDDVEVTSTTSTTTTESTISRFDEGSDEAETNTSNTYERRSQDWTATRLSQDARLPKYLDMRTDGLSEHPLPLNFGVVVPGVYRSSYPKAHDLPFIKDLKLKTIV